MTPIEVNKYLYVKLIATALQCSQEADSVAPSSQANERYEAAIQALDLAQGAGLGQDFTVVIPPLQEPILEKFGEAMVRAREPQQAAGIFQRQLDMHIQIYGNTSEQLFRIYKNLASALERSQDYDKAELIALAGVKLSETLNKVVADTIWVKYTLCLVSRHKFDKATADLRKAEVLALIDAHPDLLGQDGVYVIAQLNSNM
jgi:tetratricopeptide (TPR) repeat protein